MPRYSLHSYCTTAMKHHIKSLTDVSVALSTVQGITSERSTGSSTVVRFAVEIHTYLHERSVAIAIIIDHSAAAMKTCILHCLAKLTLRLIAVQSAYAHGPSNSSGLFGQYSSI